MASYQVIVHRTDKSVCEGTLTFYIDENEIFTTPCWENPGNLIPAKDYHSCSATIMESKQYKAVFLPNDQTGKVGIFIHQGSKPEHSDGCIVCAKARVEQMYDAIEPKNGKNVVVRVTNPA